MFTRADLGNLLALLSRVQITGAEAETTAFLLAKIKAYLQAIPEPDGKPVEPAAVGNDEKPGA